MAESTLAGYAEEARAVAAALLADHHESISAAWRAAFADLADTLGEDAHAMLADSVSALLPPMAEAIATADDSRAGDYVWQLADRLYHEDIPYPLVSRALRALKRVLRRFVRNREGIATDPAVVFEVIEECLDEIRLRLSSFYHLFAEQRLRDGEQLSRFLLNNTQDAIFVVEVDTGRINLVNAGAARLTGHTSADLYRHGFRELCAPDERDAIMECLKRCTSSGMTRFEGPGLVTADGRTLQTAMRFVHVRHETSTRLVQVLVRDISLEAGRREELQQAAYLRAFAADTADAVIVLDLDDRIRFWNKGAELIFGYTADEILNRHVGLLVPPADLPTELAAFHAVMDTEGYCRNVEAVRVARDGRRVSCNISRTAVNDPLTGDRIGASVVLRDVTEQRRLEQALNRQARQLVSINRVLEATNRTLDSRETYAMIAEHLAAQMNMDAMTVSLPGPDELSLRVRTLIGDGPLYAGEERLVRAGETVHRLAAENHEPLLIADLSAWPSLGADDQALCDMGYHSALVTPLVYDRQVIGTLMVLHRGVDRYDDEDLQLLHHLSGHFAVILDNARRFEEERKRSAQFELINKVGAAAIANIGEVNRLLHSTVEAIQSDFGYYDVAMYEVDEAMAVFRLRAQAGHRRGALGEGYEQPIDVGVFGEVLRSANSYVVNDTTADDLYFNPSPGAPTVRSELCVPLRLGPRVLGVLDVESLQANGFDRLDGAAMEALAGLLARCMQADESLRHTRMLQSLRRHIMEAVPSALLLLDDDLKVQFVNKRYLEFYGQSPDEVLGRHCTEVFPPSLVEQSGMLGLIDRLKDDLEPQDVREVRYIDFANQERVADVRLRLVTEYQTNIVVMLHDATARMARLYQLQLLREIGQEMQRFRDLEELLRAILTCITAGPGFGFNRAALFMLDRDTNALVERSRVGPSTIEEAGWIWREVSQKSTLREFLEAYEQSQEARGPIDFQPRTVPLGEGDEQLNDWRTPIRVRGDQWEQAIPLAQALYHLAGAPEVVVVPLVSQNVILGVIVADNLITQQAITEQDVNALAVFANQAGVALANAQAFDELERTVQALQEAQERLAVSERMAGIGQVAAHVAHEIRNPLVSIGGFARRIQRKAGDPNYVEQRAAIIVHEVERLERILRNVMDFTAPAKPELGETDLNGVISAVIESQQPAFEEHATTVITSLDPSLPHVPADANQITQVIINLVRNATQAMDGAGTVTLSTRRVDPGRMVEVSVQDTGPGIPRDKLQAIFNPFFTNKADGTGLGLAVSRKIIVDHGGTLTCESELGGGAKFLIRLPREAARPAEVGAGR
jgi:PAS domain S-box-containing protein